MNAKLANQSEIWYMMGDPMLQQTYINMHRWAHMHVPIIFIDAFHKGTKIEIL